ncbi:MAG TPA: L-histidine N(alpha)-methyltransferase [Gemmatimonadales bacterium]|nr:L-histidine N(alpha)-methyltransferase [Gemmatimonadales bacterium]
MSGALFRVETARGDDERAARMAEEIRRGLTARPRRLPSTYFYDDRGSRLFEDITRLPEYYLTRTEEALLAAIAGEVVARVRPVELVELGSGAGRKIRLLLAAMARAGLLERCVLMDINARFLKESTHALARDFPGLAVHGVVGDFLGDLDLLGPGGGRLAAFFASTIGNLHPDEVPPFLGRVAEHLAPDDAFLVGVDLVKDVARLEAAYNDAAGVTAEFNKNILRVLNERLGADFDPEAFAHVAFWDPARSWIEMRLRSLKLQRVRIPAAHLDLAFEAGEEIRTEISCKYTRESFAALLAGTGLVLDRWYTDPERLFALALLGRAGEGRTR